MNEEQAKKWLAVIGWLAEGKLEWLDHFGNWIKVKTVLDFTTNDPVRYRKAEPKLATTWAFVPEGTFVAYGASGYTKEQVQQAFSHIPGRVVKMVEELQ